MKVQAGNNSLTVVDATLLLEAPHGRGRRKLGLAAVRNAKGVWLDNGSLRERVLGITAIEAQIRPFHRHCEAQSVLSGDCSAYGLSIMQGGAA